MVGLLNKHAAAKCYKGDPMKFAVSLMLGFLAFSQFLSAAPVIEKFGTVEVNWRSLRLNFSAKSQSNEGFASAKEKAWGTGLLAARSDVEAMVQKKLTKLGLDQAMLEGIARESGKRVARNTFELKTTYSADRWVFVQMQSLMTNAFYNQALAKYGLGKDAPARPGKGFSGVLVQVTSAEPVKPAALLRLIDPSSGELLYHFSTVSKDAFKSRLMGKWVQSPSKNEVNRILGSSYITIQVDAHGAGEFKLANKMTERQLKLLKASLSHVPVLFSI